MISIVNIIVFKETVLCCSNKHFYNNSFYFFPFLRNHSFNFDTQAKILKSLKGYLRFVDCYFISRSKSSTYNPFTSLVFLLAYSLFIFVIRNFANLEVQLALDYVLLSKTSILALNKVSIFHITAGPYRWLFTVRRHNYKRKGKNKMFILTDQLWSGM